MPSNPTPAEEVVVPFVSPTCGGERCFCGAAAMRKVGEEIPRDDPSYLHRHNYTAYVCAEHFAMILGPAAARSVGFAARPAAPPQSAAQTAEVDEAAIGRDFLCAMEAAAPEYPWLASWSPAESYGELITDLLDLAFPSTPDDAETEITYEVWQDDMMVAGSSSEAEAVHYAFVYGQDGPVEMKKAVTTRTALSRPEAGR